MSHHKIKIFIAAAAFLLSIFLGISVLLTPQPAIEADEKSFSAARAAEHIRVIAQAPHTMEDKEERARIREYLKGALSGLGFEVNLKAYDTVDEDGIAREITNVYGELKGSTGDAVLLTAHYDSNPGKGIGKTPGSHGASDDAYGLSVILESLRAVKAQGEARNTLRVIFTDGEEAGMLGAIAAANDENLNWTDSKAVLNIESRGLRGPAILFETSKNNAALFSFYADRTKNPATWSIAPDVYRVMPNFTDFTPFIDKGMQGLNFSNLDAYDENHTPLDRFENIDYSSLQGYGDQMLPVLSGFAYEDLPDTFESDGDMVFFTLLNGLLIRYPAAFNYLLIFLSAAAVAAFIFIAVKKKLLKPSRLFFTFSVLGLCILAAAVGEGIAYLLSLIFHTPFRPAGTPNVPFSGGIAIICVLLLAAGLFFYLRALAKKGWKYEELTAGTLLAFFILQAVFTLALPGGAFLFGWGCLFGALFAILALFVPDIFRPFTGFTAIWVAAPVVVLLHVALTIGALGVVLLFSAFPLFLFLPVFAEVSANQP